MSYLVNHVGETADREALAHVTENTEQLKYSFKNRIEDTWAIMKLESRNISEHTASQSDALKAISLLEKTSEAHRVYLISKEGKYLDGSGNTGEWQLDTELLSLLRGGEPLCRLRQPDTGGDRLDFAILLERPATEQGYTVLLMEYQLDTFLETLELHAYGGQAIAYVVNGNGSTLFHTEGTLPAGHPQNYFFYQFFGDMTFEGNDQVTDVASLRETVEKG